MATKIKDFEFSRTLETYPWKKWSNGDTWLIAREVDYNGKTKQMRERLYNYARDQSAKAAEEAAKGAKVAEWKCQTQLVEVVIDTDGNAHLNDDDAPEGRLSDGIVFRYYTE